METQEQYSYGEREGEDAFARFIGSGKKIGAAVFALVVGIIMVAVGASYAITAVTTIGSILIVLAVVGFFVVAVGGIRKQKEPLAGKTE